MPKKNWYVVDETPAPKSALFSPFLSRQRTKPVLVIYYEEHKILTNQLKEQGKSQRIRKFDSEEEAQEYVDRFSGETIDLSEFINYQEDEFIAKLDESPEQYKNKICSRLQRGLIHIAAENDFAQAIKKMKELGFNLELAQDSVKEKDIYLKQVTALHIAVLYNSFSALKMLINLGANMSARSKDQCQYSPASIITWDSKRNNKSPDTLNKLANEFPYCEWSNVKVIFDGNNKIKSINYIRRNQTHVLLNERYPHAYDERKNLKPGYNLCHINGYKNARDEAIKKYIGRNVYECCHEINQWLAKHAPSYAYSKKKQDEFTRLDFSYLYVKKFETEEKLDEKNYFIGSACANKAVNWLQTVLRNKVYNFESAENFRPITIKLTPSYEPFYEVSPRFRKHYVVQDGQYYLKINNYADFIQLKANVEKDKEENLPAYLFEEQPHLYVKTARTWLKNKIREESHQNDPIKFELNIDFEDYLTEQYGSYLINNKFQIYKSDLPYILASLPEVSTSSSMTMFANKNPRTNDEKEEEIAPKAKYARLESP